jgi:hypothetical protein
MVSLRWCPQDGHVIVDRCREGRGAHAAHLRPSMVFQTADTSSPARLDRTSTWECSMLNE